MPAVLVAKVWFLDMVSLVSVGQRRARVTLDRLVERSKGE